MSGFGPVVAALRDERVRYLLVRMGTGSVAAPDATVLRAHYHELFLPPEPGNALRAWRACEAAGLELWAGGEPLGSPLDLWLAEHVVAGRVRVRATDRKGLLVDLSLLVEGFEFDDLWPGRRSSTIDGVEVPFAEARPQASEPAEPTALRLLLPPPPGFG